MGTSTVRCYLVLIALINFGIGCIAPVYTMFLSSKGFDLFQINVINAVFCMTLVVCEIPTGLCADSYGRKPAVIAACLLLSLSFFWYAVADSFWSFAVAEAIGGLGVTCMSGAFQAWAVDRLKQEQHTDAYFFSKELQTKSAAILIGALAGGVIADYSMVLSWFMGGTVLLGTALIAMIRMQEERTTPPVRAVINSLLAIPERLQTGIRFVHRSRAARLCMLLGTVNAFVLQGLNMQWPLFFAALFPSNTARSLLFVLISCCLMLGALMSVRCAMLARADQYALIGLQALIGASIVASAAGFHATTMLGAFLLHEMGRGSFQPIRDRYLNSHIPSDRRATILSVVASAERIGMSVGVLAAGWTARQTSISLAWICCGILMMVSAAVLAKIYGPED